MLKSKRGTVYFILNMGQVIARSQERSANESLRKRMICLNLFCGFIFHMMSKSSQFNGQIASVLSSHFDEEFSHYWSS